MKLMKRMLALLVLTAVLLVAAATCKPSQSPVSGSEGGVSPVVQVIGNIQIDVTAACTTITVVFPDKVVSLVCLLATEAASLADLIASQFALEIDAGPYQCVTALGYSYCTSPEHMAQAIAVLNQRRAMHLALQDAGLLPLPMLDAGVPDAADAGHKLGLKIDAGTFAKGAKR
jgi:hypothetical protein